MLIRKILAGTVLTLMAGLTHASYPDKPIRLVVGFAPGGSADVNARLTAAALSTKLGQQVVVENRAGASGVVALQHVAQSTPDGYTLLFHSSGTHVVTPHLMDMSVDPLNDLEPIVRIAQIGMAIVSHPEAGADSYSKFVEQVKSQPDKIAYGTAGQGSTHHLVMELVSQNLGLDMVHISYKGSAPALLDLTAGITPYAVDTISTAKPLIDDGRILALGVTTKDRSEQLPDIPTLAELGAGDIDASLWLGISAPQGTPQNVLDTMNQAVNELLDSPESDLREKLAATGWVNGGGSAKAFKESIIAESDRWKSVIETADISLN